MDRRSAEVRTTCPYCGVGCGVLAKVAADGDVAVRGDPDHPANFGRLCSKGSALGETIGLDGRLLHPEIDGAARELGRRRSTLSPRRSREAIAEHGPDSVAFYVSGQLLTEDYYVANKLMKGFIGSANIDTNSRLCMASSVAGHRRAFGEDTVPGTYEDLELADLVVLVGSNLAWCHPVLYQRLLAARKRARHARSSSSIRAAPRPPTNADLHLAIAPGTRCAAVQRPAGASRAERRRIDRDFVAEHTTGFDEALALAAPMRRPSHASPQGCGLDAADVAPLLSSCSPRPSATSPSTARASTSRRTAPTRSTPSSTAIWRPGASAGPGMGPFSVTGQPNAMGGREVGGLANQLAAHMGFENPADRDRVARFWQCARHRRASRA